MTKVCSLHPKKLQRAYARIEEAVASWPEVDRREMFVVGGPLEKQSSEKANSYGA